MPIKKTQEDFLREAVKVHEGTYDYSKSVYNGYEAKLIIICKIHGEFLQKPHEHIGGKNGCPECGRAFRVKNRTFDNDTFIELSNKIFNNYYSYDKCIYTKSIEKLIITCPVHGDIKMTASNHLNGYGCKKCKSIERSKNKKIRVSFEEFLNKAKKVHNDNFTYYPEGYKGLKSKVKIKCNKHNHFYKQILYTHLNGNGGCSICKSESIKKSITKTNEQFIAEASELYNNFYNYSLTNYNTNFNKVSIICPTHGVFKQKPNDHLSGHGCRLCACSKSNGASIKKVAERNKEKYLTVDCHIYFIELLTDSEKFLKVGISQNYTERLRVLKRDSKSNINIIKVIKSNLYNAIVLEQTILDKYSNDKFLPSIIFPGYTECIKLIFKQDILDML